MFAFTPITKGCLGLLICRPIYPQGHPKADTFYLGIDMSVQCFHGEHVTTAVLAALVLLVVVIVIPGLVLMKVRKGREHYYSAKGILSPSPLNPMYCMVKPQHYYWIFCEMILKLVVNFVALLGHFFKFQWQMMLQQILICAALISFRAKPVSPRPADAYNYHRSKLPYRSKFVSAHDSDPHDGFRWMQYTLQRDNDLFLTLMLVLVLLLGIVKLGGENTDNIDNLNYTGTVLVVVIFAATLTYLAHNILARKTDAAMVYDIADANKSSAGDRSFEAEDTVTVAKPPPPPLAADKLYQQLSAEDWGPCVATLLIWFGRRQPESAVVDLLAPMRKLLRDRGLHRTKDPISRGDLDKILEGMCRHEWQEKRTEQGRHYYVHPVNKPQWRRPSAYAWMDSLHSEGRLARPRRMRKQDVVATMFDPAPEPEPEPQRPRWEDLPDAHEQPMAWKRLKGDTGRDYYFNTITRKSQWAMPEMLLKQHEEMESEWEEDDNPNTAAV